MADWGCRKSRHTPALCTQILKNSHIQHLHRQQILCVELFHVPGLPYEHHSRQEEELQGAQVKLLVEAGVAQSWGLGLPDQEQTLLLM